MRPAHPPDPENGARGSNHGILCRADLNSWRPLATPVESSGRLGKFFMNVVFSDLNR